MILDISYLRGKAKAFETVKFFSVSDSESEDSEHSEDDGSDISTEADDLAG